MLEHTPHCTRRFNAIVEAVVTLEGLARDVTWELAPAVQEEIAQSVRVLRRLFPFHCDCASLAALQRVDALIRLAAMPGTEGT